MLLAALLAFSLWACSGDGEESGVSPSPSPSATPTAAPSPSPSAKPKASPSVKPKATKKPSSASSKEEEQQEAPSSSAAESVPESSEGDEGYKDYQAEGTPPPNETIEPAGGEEPPVETQPEEQAPPAANPSDFIGSDVNALYGAFGYPNSSSYASSCMGPGEDGILFYGGFTVYTYREGGVETVQSVE